MILNDIARHWADQFGLALTPLFDIAETSDGHHAVLLDGGFGSFALSVTPEELWRDGTTAHWAWSSNLPHHVTVTEKAVAITRWDRASPELLSRSSVERQAEAFYRYLTNDRVRASRRVVDHVLELFRRMRSLVADARQPDERSIEAFLAFLQLIIERDPLPGAGQKGHFATIPNGGPGRDLLRQLSKNGVEALLDSAVADPNHFSSLRLFPSLTIRHAGSEIFQEAHFELLRAPAVDLLGYVSPAVSKPVTRGGAHYTPTPLARSLVEQTLAQIEKFTELEKLVVLDPACGSGAFLQEAIRALRRLDFAGEVVLVGRDISPAAIRMAEFSIHHAIADWAPVCNVHVDVQVADSLEAPLPTANVILMNPPFMAWSAMDDRQRAQVRKILGLRAQGRSDLSMAFVELATEIIAPGGAMGVLLPSSLLTTQSAEAWRTELTERLDPRLLASLGDYGLFAHALVQVTAAVFANPSSADGRRQETLALVTNNTPDATGDALRSLRRIGHRRSATGEDNSWRMFEIPTASLARRPTWRLLPPSTEAALKRLIDSGASRIGDIFDVRQGVRTGDNKAFVIDPESFRSLPSKERRFFKPAIMNDSIKRGQISLLHWVFYPYDADGPVFDDERSMLAAVPTYAHRFLLPRKLELASRASLTSEDRDSRWWMLSRQRASWVLETRPRLVSKYFGGPGGFAVDLSAEYVVVQGYAWIPKIPFNDAGEESMLPMENLLCAYAALMHSRPFGRLLSLFSPHVAGGQFNLSPKYVADIPMPNLDDLVFDERAGQLISQLATLGREPRYGESDWHVAIDRLTAQLYGGDFFDLV